MQSALLLDCAGRRRSPATLPSFHAGRSPRNKGLRYPPDPPTVEEIIAVMNRAGHSADGLRLRALIVVLHWARVPRLELTGSLAPGRDDARAWRSAQPEFRRRAGPA
jgi:hypothetical protein